MENNQGNAPGPADEWAFPAGDIVRRLRRAADLSQRQLAKTAHVPRSTVEGIERGALDPRVGQLQRLLDLVCWSLVVVDLEGRFVVPLKEFQGDLRDGAERRFPAHLDTILDPEMGEWWGEASAWPRHRRPSPAVASSGTSVEPPRSETSIAGHTAGADAGDRVRAGSPRVR